MKNIKLQYKLEKIRELKTARGHFMPPRLHVCNRLARPARHAVQTSPCCHGNIGTTGQLDNGARRTYDVSVTGYAAHNLRSHKTKGRLHQRYLKLRASKYAKFTNQEIQIITMFCTVFLLICLLKYTIKCRVVKLCNVRLSRLLMSFLC